MPPVIGKLTAGASMINKADPVTSLKACDSITHLDYYTTRLVTGGLRDRISLIDFVPLTHGNIGVTQRSGGHLDEDLMRFGRGYGYPNYIQGRGKTIRQAPSSEHTVW
jgi:hypothetical protein